jgi:hypothetical protein
MKPIIIKITIVAMTLAAAKVHSQGFVNLNFENATITPIDSIFPTYIYASNAIPGWTAYLGGNSQDAIGYDTVSLGGAAVFIEDTNVNSLGPVPLQGTYSIFLEGSSASTPTAASIGQTGTIPVSSQSLVFYGGIDGTFQVTFNGQPLNYVETGSTANYGIYTADISTYAGQTGQLLFTAGVNSGAMIDNIRFLSTPVPEPGTFALVAVGGIALGLVKNRQRRQF